jgi:hypothetical protein
VLLTFDLTASLLYRLSPTLVEPITETFAALPVTSRPSSSCSWWQSRWSPTFPRWCILVQFLVRVRPFDVQASRVLLYASYFFIGAGIGAAHFDQGVLSDDGRLARGSWGWLAVTLIPYCLLWVMIYIKREILGNPSPQPDWYLVIYGFFFVVFVLRSCSPSLATS